MRKKELYIRQEMKMNIKQYINGNIFWLFGRKGSIKGKIKYGELKSKGNYIREEKNWIEKLYKEYKLIGYKERKEEQEVNMWIRNSFRKAVMTLTCGFKRYLRVRGVGYRFDLMNNNILKIEVGYTDELMIWLPREYKIKFSKKHTKIKLRLTDLQKLTSMVTSIRKKRIPDVYKGKGIRFIKEKRVEKVWKDEK